MILIKQLSDFQRWRDQQPVDAQIGFVPTMGCLHAGHGALVEAAVKSCETVVMSIYVNPTQFNDAADLEAYPRVLEEDLLLAESWGVDVVLAPSTDELYADKQLFSVDSTHAWTQIGEGSARPGHFKGVLTIVMKLFNLVSPTDVFFGVKDYQQVALIQAMIDAFFLRCQLHRVDTKREASGLPMSSRNRRLTHEQRENADAFARCFHDQENDTLEGIREALALLPLSVEYLIARDDRLLVAVNIGSVRLIDNRPFKTTVEV